MSSKALCSLLVVALFSASIAAAQDCEPMASDMPAVKVEYEVAGAAVGIPGALSFEASDGGTLRARDVATGEEIWTFRAPETEAASVSRGGMTKLAVLRFDANNDGVIDAGDGDRVWLYFGLKRAGAVYYALDVTGRTPRILWRADSTTMEGLGDAWSAPTIARVRIGGSRQNGEHFVVVIGGGLAPGGASATLGNRLFMLDAASGRVLWSAGDVAPASFISARMTESFASRVVAIDLDGDQFADRLYAADVGARIWRFDIWNGKPADQLVTGGVFASLGAIEPFAPGAPPPTAADARKFFNAPDVAYIQPRGEASYYSLSIGSGDAIGSRPVHDRFYSLRDYAPLVQLSQAEYDALTPIFDGDLSTSTAGALGWKLDLAAGERVLTESLTIDGTTLFSSFQPDALCGATGTNRIYAVEVESGKAVLDLDGDTAVTDSDIAISLEERGAVIAPRMTLIPPAARPGAWPATEDSTGHTPSARRVVRTFWMRTTIH